MRSLLLVGCGKMGSALLAGWRAAGLLKDLKQLCVLDPAHGPERNEGACFYTDHVKRVPFAPEVVLFAVKPQSLESVLAEYSNRWQQSPPLYITIAAGKEVAFYQRYLGAQARIIRAMPNTPALVQQGVTALYAPQYVNKKDQDFAETLFDAVGRCVWLEKEENLHILTALTGCGPAYVYQFIESWINAGIELGVPAEYAQELVKSTLYGSVELLKSSGEAPQTLKKNVASPGGATQAALEVLEANDIEGILESALKAAAIRSKELAG